jgi:hypothetical protein
MAPIDPALPPTLTLNPFLHKISPSLKASLKLSVPSFVEEEQ